MALTKETTAKELQKLVDYCFELNSIADNAVYSLQLELRLPKFAEWIHLNMAHKFPLWADMFQEFALMRGVRIYRGQVSAHTNTFSNPIVCLEKLYSSLVGFEMMLDRAIDVAIEDRSKPTEDFLRSFSASTLPEYIFQVSQFVEGLRAYDEDNIVSSFNKDYKSFVIPQLRNGN